MEDTQRRKGRKELKFLVPRETLEELASAGVRYGKSAQEIAAEVLMSLNGEIHTHLLAYWKDKANRALGTGAHAP